MRMLVNFRPGFLTTHLLLTLTTAIPGLVKLVKLVKNGPTFRCTHRKVWGTGEAICCGRMSLFSLPYRETERKGENSG